MISMIGCRRSRTPSLGSTASLSHRTADRCLSHQIYNESLHCLRLLRANHMSTAQGHCCGFFEGLHPLSPLASQLLLNSFGIHAHDASKESSVYQGLSGFRCVLRSSSNITPEEVVPLQERWPIYHADDGMDTLLRTFRDQLCLSSKAEEGSASGLCLAVQSW